jgi:peptidoglycan lytic transglycosylase G
MANADVPRSRPRRRRLIAWALVLVVLIAAAGAALFGWYAGRIQRPFKGYSAAEQFVDIPPGLGVTAIGRRLVAAGVVPDLITYRIAVRMRRAERSLKAGEYRFDHPMSPLAVVDKLGRGDVFLQAITFPEGLTIAEMARVYETSGLGPSASFIDAARDGTLVRAIDPKASDLEGYLFPDTYRLPRRTSARDLVRAMVARFDRELTPQKRESIRSRGWTVR